MSDKLTTWKGPGHEPHCVVCNKYITRCTCSKAEEVKPLKVNLGCRTKPLPTYVNVDINPNNKYADIIDDGLKLNKFEDGSISLIEATHMFEHLAQDETKEALRVWKRKLKPGGILRLSVPDMAKCSALLLLTNHKRTVSSMFYGSQRAGDQWDFHKSLHTKTSLTNELEEAGFVNIREWDWRTTWPHNYVDTFASAYWPPMRKNFILDNGGSVDLGGVLMSLNLEGEA